VPNKYTLSNDIRAALNKFGVLDEEIDSLLQKGATDFSVVEGKVASWFHKGEKVTRGTTAGPVSVASTVSAPAVAVGTTAT
jgi:hypothetical protein